MENVLNLFDPLTKRWFEADLGEPTTVQKEAWPAIGFRADRDG
jgi:Lhr-like helicase